MKEGVMVGCDQKQEWLLPWWWHNYCLYNTHPVVFVDFGMTKEVQSWCAERGEVIALECPKSFVFSSSLVSKELIFEWEERFGKIEWQARSQRFYKPFAMLQTPFFHTLWLDVDCEVLGNLTPLFRKIHPLSGMALTSDRDEGKEEREYNSGVVVYHKTSSLLQKWAMTCLSQNDRFYSDQEALAFLIHAENIEIAEIADKYNWQFTFGVNIEAVILHWSGQWGKEILRRSIK